MLMNGCLTFERTTQAHTGQAGQASATAAATATLLFSEAAFSSVFLASAASRLTHIQVEAEVGVDSNQVGLRSLVQDRMLAEAAADNNRPVPH
jgi:hypothetical protein